VEERAAQAAQAARVEAEAREDPVGAAAREDPVEAAAREDPAVPCGSGGSGGSGGAGGTGGTGGGCTNYATWPSTFPRAAYNTSNDYTWGQLYLTNPATPPTAGNTSLVFEVWWNGGPTSVPYSYTFSGSDKYGTCNTCLVAFENCPPGGSCQRMYFARAGSASVTRADKTSASGRITATANNLRLEEWNYSSSNSIDAPVDGGRCITVGSASWDIPWPADAGTGGSGGAGGSGGSGGGTGGAGGASGWVNRGTGGPSARTNHSMAYDAARGEVVLYGGETSGGDSTETWTWNGTSWTNRGSQTGASFHARMAYDSVRQVVVRHDRAGVTWEWDGVSWTNKSTSGPYGRSDYGMAFDSIRGKTVLFGGTAIYTTSDVYEWDGTTWTHPQPSTTPMQRAEHAVSWDGTRNAVLVFGGHNDAPVWLGSAAEWNGTSWWISSSSAGPDVRIRPTMAFHAARGAVILFGGRSLFGEEADTWQRVGAVWSELSLSGPSARYGAAMAYDSARQRIVLFGGDTDHTSAGGLKNDTWELLAQ
jgi:hypothetical protein